MPWISGAIGLAGSLLSSGNDGGAGAAAAAQGQASAAAIAEQRRQYDQTRADQEPWRNTGVAANERLRYLLGLGGGSTDTRAIRERLLPQYTRNTTVRGDPYLEPVRNDGDFFAGGGIAYGPDKTTSTVDEESLAAAIAREVGTPNDPAYGSLTRNFGLSDLESDPIYQKQFQFGLDEGTKGLNRQMSAGRMSNSGAALKALTRFATDYTGTKAGESYNRYNTNNTNTYNRLAGVSGTGQTATNMIGSAGQNSANSISGMMTGLGNAQGASIIAGQNSQNAGMGNVFNAAQRFAGSLGSANIGGLGNTVSNAWTGQGASGGFIDPNTYNLNYG